MVSKLSKVHAHLVNHVGIFSMMRSWEVHPHESKDSLYLVQNKSLRQHRTINNPEDSFKCLLPFIGTRNQLEVSGSWLMEVLTFLSVKNVTFSQAILPWVLVTMISLLENVQLKTYMPERQNHNGWSLTICIEST